MYFVSHALFNKFFRHSYESNVHQFISGEIYKLHNLARRYYIRHNDPSHVSFVVKHFGVDQAICFNYRALFSSIIGGNPNIYYMSSDGIAAVRV